MRLRPASVTIIGIIVLVLGMTGGISAILRLVLHSDVMRQEIAKNGLPISLQYAISIVGPLVYLTGGYYLLRVLNWARYLYFTWTVLMFAISLATSPMKMMLLPGILIFG